MKLLRKFDKISYRVVFDYFYPIKYLNVWYWLIIRFEKGFNIFGMINSSYFVDN